MGGICVSGGRWEGTGGGLSVCCSRFSLCNYCMVLYLMCFFDSDFSGDYVIELFGQ